MDLTQTENRPERRRSAPVPAEEAEEFEPVWPPERIALAEALWGEGFLSPLAAEEVRRLVRPLGLSAASSVLLLGYGAGGPAWLLAEEFEAWISGYEARPELVALSASRAKHADPELAKRGGNVTLWQPAASAFRARGFSHAVVLDALGEAPAEPVLAALAAAVRPGGQVALVQTLAEAPLDPAVPAVAAWCRAERCGPDLPLRREFGAAFERAGFEIRVQEDVSARYMALAVAGWRSLVASLAERGRPTPAYAALLVAEAECCLRRLRLLNSGAIRLIRWHAIRRGEARPAQRSA